VFDRSNNFNVDNRIDGGNGELIKRGNGIMTMAANTDVKNNALTIEEGGVITQKGTRYFAVGHLVGGSGLTNGATITIENGAFLDIDGNRNLDGDVGYALGARGNVQVVLNGGEMNFLGDTTARDNIVGSITANNGGSVTVENNHRLDLNNSGGITTNGTGAVTVDGAGSLNLAIRNTTGSTPVMNVGANAPLTISTDITSINVGTSVGGLGFEKTGSGALTLSGTNTYAGDTRVNGGSLFANGSLISNVIVGSGGTLGGSGTVGDVTVTSGGILAAGNSAGILSTGNVSLTGGSTLDFEFGLSASDRIDADGNLSLGGATLSLTDLNTGSLAVGDSLTLIRYTGSWDNSTFNGLANASSFSSAGYDWEIVYDNNVAGSLNGGSGGNYVTVTVIPEPSTLISMLIGLVACVCLNLRRKKR
jgi:fibronectin-binding autotransporter adhesin